jgi:electron transport complex protein RnfG
VPASGQGFADRIELLVGLNTDLSTITGLYVLNQKETPGLGNLITSDELFLNQFAGKSTEEPLVAVKTDPVAGSNQIRALTGATISSESVADIVNDAMDNLKGPIRRLAEAAPQNAGPETAAPGVNNIQQKDEN